MRRASPCSPSDLTLPLVQGQALPVAYCLLVFGKGSDGSSASAVSSELMAGARGEIVALACSSVGSLHRVIVVHSGSSPLVWDLRQAPIFAGVIATDKSLGSDINLRTGISSSSCVR